MSVMRKTTISEAFGVINRINVLYNVLVDSSFNPKIMSLSEEAIKEFKEIYEKKHGKELSDAEASESANNLFNLVRVLHEQAQIDYRRKLRLKDEPKGFHLTGEGYTCPICRMSMSNENTWYDKYGMKCILCQKALEKRIIPVSAVKNRDSWYSVHDFDYYYGIRSQRVHKLVREGKLKSRIIPSPDSGVHFELFLIKDNPDVLIKKPESYVVKTEDGFVHIEYEKVKLPEVLETLRTK